jgi:hypothetical protein
MSVTRPEDDLEFGKQLACVALLRRLMAVGGFEPPTPRI